MTAVSSAVNVNVVGGVFEDGVHIDTPNMVVLGSVVIAYGDTVGVVVNTVIVIGNATAVTCRSR
eukprot:6721152-Pyramimonas_sp.AAC.1